MKELRGATALVTGGSGGIGAEIARALARVGANVVVAARREDALRSVVEQLRALGVRAEALPADLSLRDQVESLIDRANELLGPVDVLVNNAGVEDAASYTRVTREELISMIDLNLTAPMLLTHAALPGMLERGRGHVVFISSVAGKLGPAYQAPYAASKAGLIGLTQSLRAEYLNSPVGFSVACPGFVEGDGMYQRMAEAGLQSNWLMRSTPIHKVAERVVLAIRDDRPEVIEAGTPLRPILALGQVAPRLIERAAPRVGVTELFRRTAQSRGRAT
jgi:short-subunit dehydrogenase